MTESQEKVTEIVGSGAPVEEASNLQAGSGDLEYDEVHRFLGEMSAEQEKPPPRQQDS